MFKLAFFPEPKFYGDLVYTFRKVVSVQPKSLASKKIGCNMEFLWQTAFMVVNSIMVDSVVSIFNFTKVGRISD